MHDSKSFVWEKLGRSRRGSLRAAGLELARRCRLVVGVLGLSAGAAMDRRAGGLSVGLVHCRNCRLHGVVGEYGAPWGRSWPSSDL